MMNRLMIAAAAALALAGCSFTAPEGPGSVQSTGTQVVADKVVLEGTRGLIMAELAYNQVASMALAATQAGLIKGERATQVREWNRVATRALVAGKAAQGQAERARQATVIFNAVDQLRALIT